MLSCTVWNGSNCTGRHHKNIIQYIYEMTFYVPLLLCTILSVQHHWCYMWSPIPPSRGRSHASLWPSIFCPLSRSQCSTYLWPLCCRSDVLLFCWGRTVGSVVTLAGGVGSGNYPLNKLFWSPVLNDIKKSVWRNTTPLLNLFVY